MRRFAPLAAVLAAALAAGSAAAADAALIAAAKKEGSVTWYTSAIVDQFVRPAIDAFEAKYAIKVDYARASPPELVLRVYNEAKAGRMLADVVDGTTTAVDLRKQDMMEKWIPQTSLPARYVDPDGYWIACNEYVLTPGINTDLVPDAARPKSWDDLLDPKWKGKMVWNTIPVSSAAQGFVGLVLTELGDEKGRAYLKRLATQDVASMKATARQVLDQTIAGEYPIALQIFNNHATISKAKGAPVDWLAMQPALAVLASVGLTKGAPHPNAGKLLIDFIVSDEGQRVMAKAGELPVAPNIPPLDPNLRPQEGRFRAIYMQPEKLQTSMAGWNKVYEEIFR